MHKTHVHVNIYMYVYLSQNALAASEASTHKKSLGGGRARCHWLYNRHLQKMVGHHLAYIINSHCIEESTSLDFQIYSLSPILIPLVTGQRSQEQLIVGGRRRPGNRG